MATAYNVDGEWVVADGYWLPGIYESEEAALAWAERDDAEISEAWSKAKPKPLGMPQGPAKEGQG